MKSKLVGQRLKMKNGMYATCIAFHSFRNIDVEFEDGTIVQHKSGASFKAGSIANPNLGKNFSARKSIVGLTLLMNNGMEATCVGYRGSRDIDVQFSDGTVVKNKQKIHFLKGAIENPHSTPSSLPQRMVFEYVSKYFKEAKFNFRPDFMRNSITGAKLEIDIWVPECGVAIEYDGFPWHQKETKTAKEKARLFETLDVVKTIYTLVEKGCVIHNGPKHFNFVLPFTSGSSNDIFSSLWPVLRKHIITILKQLGIQDPKVDLDDETLSRIRKSFTNSLIGKTLTMNNGMAATCIAYQRSDNIDIQFEDGTIVSKVNKTSFLAGTVANPALGRGKAKMKDFVGLSKVMNNGMTATIIGCRGYQDIDVQFEDGTIVRNIPKERYNRGNVANPTLGKNYAVHQRASVEGKTIKMKCGLDATCLEDNGAMDLTIRFEDGALLSKVSRSNFLKGAVAHPELGRQVSKKRRSSVLGQTRKMNNGLLATCIAYRGSDDIDVQFEDGVVVEHKTKGCFLRGSIGHPNMTPMTARINRSSCVGISKRMRNGMLARCIAYRGSDDIDVQFEDGTIAKNKSKSKFLKGNIGHPQKN